MYSDAHKTVLAADFEFMTPIYRKKLLARYLENALVKKYCKCAVLPQPMLFLSIDGHKQCLYHASKKNRQFYFHRAFHDLYNFFFVFKFYDFLFCYDNLHKPTIRLRLCKLLINIYIYIYLRKNLSSFIKKTFSRKCIFTRSL